MPSGSRHTYRGAVMAARWRNGDGTLVSESVIAASPACGRSRTLGKISQMYPSLACYLTLVVCAVLSCLCCPACRGDMRRAPLHDLRVPSTESGGKGGGRGFHYVLA